MAKWISLTLLIAYSVAFMRPFLPFVQYQIEKDYYVNVLCKNRLQPELHCDGKCALMEKLKAAAEENLPGAPMLPDDLKGSDFLGVHLLPKDIISSFFPSIPTYLWDNCVSPQLSLNTLWRPPEF